MKKIIVSLFIITVALFGAELVLADEQTGDNLIVSKKIQDTAGIMPSSLFYYFDRLGEEINKILLIPLPRTRLDYLQKLKEEKEAELVVIEITDKQYSSPETTDLKELIVGTWADMEDMRRKDADQVKKGLLSRLELQTNHLPQETYISDAKADEIQAVNKRLSELNNEKTALRKDIEKARTVDDPAILQTLLTQLKTVKSEYAKISVENNNYNEAVARERKRVEDLLTGPEMADKIKTEIEAAQGQLYAAAERSGVTIKKVTMAPIDDLLKQAEKMATDQKLMEFKGVIEFFNRYNVTQKSLPEEKAKQQRSAEYQRLMEFLDRYYEMQKSFDKAMKSVQANVDAAIVAREKNEMTVEEKADLKKQEAKNILETTPTAPAVKPPLRPLGEPMPTASQPLVFAPSQTNFSARVGEQFSYSFCQPAVSETSDLCTGSTDPQFGIPPYSFKYDTMGGFVPFGLTLNKNGLLAGVPTVESSAPFKVCAVDQGGFSVCQTITINIQPKLITPEPEPTPLPQPTIYCPYGSYKLQCLDYCQYEYANSVCGSCQGLWNFDDLTPYNNCRNECAVKVQDCYVSCQQCPD